MTADSIWRLKEAVYTRLTNDSTLMALVTGVFDHVPQDADYPYVSFGDATSTDWSTKTTTGWEISLAVEVFSRERGSKECLDILSRIHELLHDVDLSVTNHALVLIRFESNEILQKADGLTYQGINNFRALLEEL